MADAKSAIFIYRAQKLGLRVLVEVGFRDSAIQA